MSFAKLKFFYTTVRNLESMISFFCSPKAAVSPASPVLPPRLKLCRKFLRTAESTIRQLLIDHLSLSGLSTLISAIPSSTLFNSLHMSLICILSYLLRPLALFSRVYTFQRTCSVLTYSPLRLLLLSILSCHRIKSLSQCGRHRA